MALQSSGAGSDNLHDCFQELKEAIERKQQKGELQGTDVHCRIDVLAPRPRSWVIDLSGKSKELVEELRDGPGSGNVKTSLVMTYASEEVFFALKSKRLNPRTAVVKGDLRLQGDLSKLRGLQAVFEAAEKGGSVEGEGRDEGRRALKPVPKSRWEPDGPACKLCLTTFTVTLRRHHCRFCGALSCKDCSRFRLSNHRACGVCFLKQRAAWGHASLPHLPLPDNPTNPPQEGEEEEDVKERLFSLEAKLRALERNRHEKKGRVLLRLADTLALSVLLSTLLSSLLLSHQLALLASSPFAASLASSLWQGVSTGGPQWAGAHFNSYGGPQLLDGLTPPLLKSLFQQCPSPSTLPSLLPTWLVLTLQPLLARFDRYWATLLLLLSLLARVLSDRRLRRSIEAFSVASILVLTLKLSQAKARRKGGLSGAADALWDRTHSFCAAYLRLAFFRLGGMYLKLGQYVSSRADLVPEAYTEELASLQDAVPPSPIERVRPIIERELGGKLSEVFEQFWPEAIASASIAQVHRARMVNGHQDVVVKVQHPDIAETLSIDLSNIVTIFRTIAKLEPASDFTAIAQEWASEVWKELDFRTEGDNIQRAYEGFSKSGLEVDVPQLVTTTNSVLVMTFCEGVKVTDPRAFPGGAEDRRRYMTMVCEAFAHSMYIQGFFNGDPHPGNLLVQTLSSPPSSPLRAPLSPATASPPSHPATPIHSQSDLSSPTTAPSRPHIRPVLLDWGLAKALPENVRLGNAKAVYCLWRMDIAGMLNGMFECGMDVSKMDILQDIKSIRFFMRDTSPGVESRAASERFFDEFMAHQNTKPKDERNPLKAMIPDAVFLTRVTELLQGLASKLNTRVEYMDIMARFCKLAIIESVPRPIAETPEGPIAGRPPISFLDRKVRALLSHLSSEGAFLGGQVVMIKHGRVLVNTSLGQIGHVDPRAVHLDTLFPAHTLGHFLLSLLAHSLVSDGILAYSTPLSRFVPSLSSCPALASITLEHVLTHTAGLAYMLPPNPTPQSMCQASAGDKAMQHTPSPATDPGTKTSFHHFSYGWLLVPLLENAARRPIAELLRERVTGPLAIADELFVGPLPAHLIAGDRKRLASVDYDLRASMASMGGEPGGMPSMGPSPTENGEEGGPLLALLDLLPPNDDDRDEKALRELVGQRLSGREFLLDPRLLNYFQLEREHGLPGLNARFSARAMAEVLESLCRAERRANGQGGFNGFGGNGFGGNGPSGPSTPSPTTRTAPSSSRSAQAAAIRRMVTPLPSPPASPDDAGPILLPAPVLQSMRAHPRDEHPRLTRLLGRDSPIRLARGTQLFGFGPSTSPSSPLSPSNRVRYSAYGHASACGQLALCDPSSGLVLVVTSNRAPPPGMKSVGQEVLNLVASELDMGTPLPIW